MDFVTISRHYLAFTLVLWALFLANRAYSSIGTAVVGQSLTLSVSAAGTVPFSYQWFKDGTAIPGATEATYSISSLQTTDAGNYDAVVSNSAGSATSDTATLVVSSVSSAAPTITTQPASRTVPAGASATFRAAGSGTPAPTFQWQKNGAPIAGATSASYTISSVATSDAGTYSVVATNSAGVATSTGAVLTVTNVDNSGGGPAVMTAPLTVRTLGGQPLVSGSTDGTGAVARFNSPSGVAVDPAGNLYVADTDNHTVRKVVAATGAVTTLAGLPGVPGSADGTGQGARFNGPSGVAVDGAGDIYVADTLNHTLRKVTPLGVVSTLAGIPGASGSTDGAGSAARFFGPQGIALDGAGSLFVADTNNHTIRKVTLATGGVTTVAGGAGSSGSTDGSGSIARFNHPSDLAVDSAGSIYVADTENDTLRIILPSGVVSTAAGVAGGVGASDGRGAAAQFAFPSAVAVDAAGIVYVADTGNFTVRMLDPATGSVSTLAGLAGISGSADGAGSAVRFFSPAGIAVDGSGDLYVADTNNDTIRVAMLGAAPIIQTQPQSQTVSAGDSVAFSVVATGRATLTYQWYRNGGAVNGATAGSLDLAGAQSGDAGNYTVTVTNALGSATSNPATLTVNGVASQPSSISSGGGGGGGGGGAPSWWFLVALVLAGLTRLAVPLRRKRAGTCN